MATLRRVGPGSAFKVGLVVYAFLGLLVGICMALFSMVAGSLTGMAGADATTAKMMGFGMGFGAIIIFPILYGIIGGIGGASKSISARRIRFRANVSLRSPVCIFYFSVTSN